MAWKLRLVEEIGRIYQAVWTIDTGKEHVHSYHREITKEDYESSDKYERYERTEHLVCKTCGQDFESGKASFGSSPRWNTEDGKLHVGDMYYAQEEWCEPFSPDYIRDWKGKRKPIYVMTPGGGWCVDQQSISKGVWQGTGWKVVGEAPDISVTPSINFPGEYHGWVTNGILTDDCEGRKF